MKLQQLTNSQQLSLTIQYLKQISNAQTGGPIAAVCLEGLAESNDTSVQQNVTCHVVMGFHVLFITYVNTKGYGGLDKGKI